MNVSSIKVYYPTGSTSFQSSTSFSFQVPAGVKKLKVHLAGGGGGGSDAVWKGGGGAYWSGIVDVTPGTNINVTVGAGGADQSNGGSSRFGNSYNLIPHNSATVSDKSFVLEKSIYIYGDPVYYLDPPTAPYDGWPACYLSGNQYYMSLSAFDITQGFSQLVWISATESCGIACMYNIPEGSWDKMFWISPTGTACYGIFNGGTNILSTTSAITDGNWHFLCGVVSSTGTFLYLDGLLQDSISETYAQNYQGYWYCGRYRSEAWDYTASSMYFSGYLSSAAFVPVALDAASVSYLYNPESHDAYSSSVMNYGAMFYLDNANFTHISDVVSVDFAQYITSGGPTEGWPSASLNDGQYFRSLNTYDITQGFSQLVWVNTTESCGIACMYNSSLGDWDKMIWLSPTGTVCYGTNPDAAGVTVLSTTTAITDGDWHFLCGVVSSTGTFLYLDGSLQASNSATVTQEYNGYWYFGYYHSDGFPYTASSVYFDGQLSGAAVLATALGSTEVSDLYSYSGYYAEYIQYINNTDNMFSLKIGYGLDTWPYSHLESSSTMFFSNDISIGEPSDSTSIVWISTTSSTCGINAFKQPSGAGYGRAMWLNSDGTVGAGDYDSGAITIGSTIAVTDGNWHFLAFVFEASAGIKLYIDGVLAAISSVSLVSQDLSGEYYVGNADIAWGGTMEPFNGNMAGSALIPSILNENDILNLYHSTYNTYNEYILNKSPVAYQTNEIYCVVAGGGGANSASGSPGNAGTPGFIAGSGTASGAWKYIPSYGGFGSTGTGYDGLILIEWGWLLKASDIISSGKWYEYGNSFWTGFTSSNGDVGFNSNNSSYYYVDNGTVQTTFSITTPMIVAPGIQSGMYTNNSPANFNGVTFALYAPVDSTSATNFIYNAALYLPGYYTLTIQGTFNWDGAYVYAP